MYILFDLDGTLTDTEYLHHEADAFILKQFNINFNEELEKKTFDLIQTTGLKQMDVFNFYIDKFKINSTPEFFLNEKLKYFKKAKVKLFS